MTVRLLRRLALAAVLAALVAPATAAAQAQPASVPSHQTPNRPGSLALPLSLSTPPPVPERRSYAQLLALWKAAGAAYGVPWEVLGAINKIESNFGRNMGPSSAGAVGWMQFMPDTWARWGWDFDGDGVANPWDPEDAIYAAARYLAAAGAQTDLSRAIFAYNHADWYVRDVLELAQVFAGGGGFDATLGSSAPSSSLGFTAAPAGPEIVFQLDDLEKRLAKARRAVNRAQRAVVRAERRAQELDTEIFAAERRAGDPDLSDEEFQRVEAEVTALVLEQERTVASIGAKRAALGKARERMQEVRRLASERASTITFTRSPAAVASGLGDPQFSGQYVFPVGGGPATVSVAADHHDYPAADIAAPEGAPLYALADGIVTRTYPSASGRCGIGFHLKIADGTEYLYCHLSYLEPSVTPGAALAAGAPVGLVGSTGNSTGPHLHLQHVPVKGYPQHEAWFQSFAGVAFRWQGAPPPPAAEPAAAPAGGRVLTFTP